MTQRLWIFVFGIVLLASCSQRQVAPATSALAPLDGAPAGFTDTVARYVRDFPEHSQIALALVRDSQVLYYGVIRQAGQLQTIENAGAVFEIGSISKVFTATLLSHFAHEGRIDLDTAVQAYLPFPLKGQPAITLRQLANHTSGLPRMPNNFWGSMLKDPDNPYAAYDRSKLEAYLQNRLKLDHPPGETYAYSNLGAGLAGDILERVSGQSYEALLQSYIFTPLGMTRSSTLLDGFKDVLVPGQNPKGKPTSNWDINALIAAGGIKSNAEDLVRFMHANFSPDPVLEFQREKTFSVPGKNMDLALGWHILHQKDDAAWFWHNGGTGGYRTSLAFDTAQKTGVVVLSNVSAKNNGLIDQLCFALMGMMR